MRYLLLLLVILALPLAGAAGEPVPLRVAVLPFSTPGDKPALAIHGAGTMESLIHGLKSLPGLDVVDRSQIDRAIKGQAAALAGQGAVNVGKLVGAQVLVSGSIQAAGDQVRVAAQFTDVATSRITDSHQVTGPLAGIGGLQGDLATHFIRSQKVAVTPEQQARIDKILKATDNLSAYEAYLNGRKAYLLYTPQGFQQAVDWYKQALAADPGYALAQAGLAETWSFWGHLQQQAGRPAKAQFEQAYAASLAALKLNAELPEAFRAFAWAANYLGKPGFEVTMHKALELNPNDAETWYGYWVASGHAAEPDHAYIKKALALDPELAAALLDRGVALARLKRYAEAAAEFRHALAASPAYATAYNDLGAAFAALKRHDEAVAAYREALRLDPDYATAHENLGKSLALQGKKADAVLELETYLKLAPEARDAPQIRQVIDALRK